MSMSQDKEICPDMIVVILSKEKKTSLKPIKSVGIVHFKAIQRRTDGSWSQNTLTQLPKTNRHRRGTVPWTAILMA